MPLHCNKFVCFQVIYNFSVYETRPQLVPERSDMPVNTCTHIFIYSNIGAKNITKPNIDQMQFTVINLNIFNVQEN